MSLHPKYPMNIPPKNTENTIINNKYVIRSIEPLAMNDAQKIEPTNKNTPNIMKENIIIGKLVFSIKLSKNPLEEELFISLIDFDKSYPHSVQYSTSTLYYKISFVLNDFTQP